MGKSSATGVTRPVLAVAVRPRPTWGVGGISLDRYFTRIAVLPTFLVMLGIFGIPLLFSLYLSFTGWSMDQAPLGADWSARQTNIIYSQAAVTLDGVFVFSAGFSTFGVRADGG